MTCEKILKNLNNLIDLVPINKTSLLIVPKNNSTQMYKHSLVKQFKVMFNYEDAIGWFWKHDVLKRLVEIKHLFEQYFIEEGMDPNILASFKQPMWIEHTYGECNEEIYIKNHVKNSPLLTYVDGFIMEAKSEYTATCEGNILRENDFYYRGKMRNGKCLLDLLHLMPAFHLISSKMINYDIDLSQDSYIERFPISCCIFDSCDFRYIYLSLLIDGFIFQQFENIPHPLGFQFTSNITFFLNMRSQIPYPSKREFECKFYKTLADYTKASFSYYLHYTLFMDYVSSNTLNFFGIKLNNNNTACLNYCLDYLVWISPPFINYLTKSPFDTFAIKKFQFLEYCLKNNLDFYCINDDLRIYDKINFASLMHNISVFLNYHTFSKVINFNDIYLPIISKFPSLEEETNILVLSRLDLYEWYISRNTACIINNFTNILVFLNSFADNHVAFVTKDNTSIKSFHNPQLAYQFVEAFKTYSTKHVHVGSHLERNMKKLYSNMIHSLKALSKICLIPMIELYTAAELVNEMTNDYKLNVNLYNNDNFRIETQKLSYASLIVIYYDANYYAMMPADKLAEMMIYIGYALNGMAHVYLIINGEEYTVPDIIKNVVACKFKSKSHFIEYIKDKCQDNN